MNNLLLRCATGIVFLVLMVAGMIFHPAAFTLLFLVVLYFSLSEFLHITMGDRWQVQQRLAIFAAVLLYLLVTAHRFYGLGLNWLAVVLVPVLLIPLSVILSPSHDDVEANAFSYAALPYVTLPFCLMPVIVSGGGEFRGYLLLNFFIIIWCADIGSYCFGTLFGQRPDSRKLAPSISPKKSWWGFWGGIATASAASVLLFAIGWMPYSLPHCLALGVLISASGVCGDLFESVWKRRYGFKDSGKIIPGHGGMLDRFDSSLLAIPVAFVYLVLTGLL